MDERQKDKSDLEMQVAMLEKEIADLKQQIKERRFLKGITFEDMMPEGEEKGTDAPTVKTLKLGDEIVYGNVAAKPTMDVRIIGSMSSLGCFDAVVAKLNKEYSDDYALSYKVLFKFA